MPAPTTNSPPIHRGIVAYVTTYGQPRQRERIEAALAEVGATALEIVEETPRLPGEGRHGLARVYEHARRSDVDTILVASLDILFGEQREGERWAREMAARHGVSVQAVE